MQHMMHQMNSMGQSHGHGHESTMMGGGMKGMMNPEMMQMRMKHMTNMEQRFENIESLLSQLVELQKAN